MSVDVHTVAAASPQRHNRLVLEQVTGVDPHRWAIGAGLAGWHMDFWEIDFGEAHGTRLGVVDVLKRTVPEQQEWPHAEAVAAIDSAWPAGPIVVGRNSPRRVLKLMMLRLGRMTADEFDEPTRDAYERAADAARCAAMRSGDTLAAGPGDFVAAAVGVNARSGGDDETPVTARQLAREDCIGDIDWNLSQAGGPSYAPSVEAVDFGVDETWELACALGRMVDRWCPIPGGDAVRARAAGAELNVNVKPLTLDVDWFTYRRSLGGSAAVWWCAWCSPKPAQPAPYLVGHSDDGPVCCETHLRQAAAAEIAMRGDDTAS